MSSKKRFHWAFSSLVLVELDVLTRFLVGGDAVRSATTSVLATIVLEVR